jgi:hypothetical protein
MAVQYIFQIGDNSADSRIEADIQNEIELTD